MGRNRDRQAERDVARRTEIIDKEIEQRYPNSGYSRGKTTDWENGYISFILRGHGRDICKGQIDLYDNVSFGI
jgi:hypothetical protein